ncbi:hypothetical protein [Bdellovibrio sp. HCB209]|uniref:hypothetical protein n=1 Tax=Bdellovibrio sp. HCB209 TaxID=3394354 RepID=UPI0039B6769A
MSMISKLVLTVVLFTTPFAAFAGDELLNGGDVIACPGLEVPSYRSLDIYEGDKVYGLQPTAIAHNDFKVILKTLIDRIAKHDITRANLYRSYLQSLESEVRMVTGSDFGNIRDEGWIAIPKGCELQQAAAQFRDHSPDGVKYLINGSIWTNLNSGHRAALIMHEFIYREGLLPQNDFKNSARVRYFNAFIHSEKFKTLTAAEYWKAVNFAGFKN